MLILFYPLPVSPTFPVPQTYPVYHWTHLRMTFINLVNFPFYQLTHWNFDNIIHRNKSCDIFFPSQLLIFTEPLRSAIGVAASDILAVVAVSPLSWRVERAGLWGRGERAGRILLRLKWPGELVNTCYRVGIIGRRGEASSLTRLTSRNRTEKPARLRILTFYW